MAKRKNIVLCILASILTCGIYGLFWLVSMVNNLNALEKDRERSETSGGMVLLFTILTCGIYGIYWAYKAGERIDRMKNERGMPTSNNLGMLYLILCILSYFVGVTGLVVYALIQDEINKLIDAKENGR